MKEKVDSQSRSWFKEEKIPETVGGQEVGNGVHTLSHQAFWNICEYRIVKVTLKNVGRGIPADRP